MNNKRRKHINNIINILETSKDEISEILEEEQDAFDNLPENLMESERGELAQNAIDLLEEAVNNVEEAINNLEEARE